MSIALDPIAAAPHHEVLMALQAGSDGIEQFIDEVLSDMESMYRAFDKQREQYHQRYEKLENEKQRLTASLEESLNKVSSQGETVDPTLQIKINELEQDRQALEQELEEVRNRAADLAKTVGEQKRQMADERAEWTAELRQLRRILDKQASWIAQQTQQPPAAIVNSLDSPNPVQQLQGQSSAVNPNGCQTSNQPATRDPVLGSVLSQFELLRKDLQRRRAPPSSGGKNVNAS